MTERVKWICPFCNKTLAVPSVDGLTACPTCQAEDAADTADNQSGLGMSERIVVRRELFDRLTDERPTPLPQRQVHPGIWKAVTTGALGVLGLCLVVYFLFPPKPAAKELYPLKNEQVLAERPNEVVVQAPKDRQRTEFAASAPLLVEYRELTSSRATNRKSRSILIPTGISETQLIALAKKLHSEDTTSMIRFFDDDTEFEAFRLSNENYPDKRFPHPDQWANQHHLAFLNKFPPRGRWELHAECSRAFELFPSAGKNGVIAIID